MDNKVFTEKIYGPYNEAWKLIKLLQHCTATSGDWDKYVEEFKKFCNMYPDNDFAYDLGCFILKAADDIRDMNGGLGDAIQKT